MKVAKFKSIDGTTTKVIVDDGKCPDCNGWGQVSTMNPFGHETTYECPTCGGGGALGPDGGD